MSKKNPSTTLFWKDLQEDVKILPPAAQALWAVWCLPLCKTANGPGVLELRGKPITLDDPASIGRLAREIGWDEALVAECLAAIADEGVATKRDDGRILNRRIARDAEKARKRSEAGKLGGKASAAARRALKQNEAPDSLSEEGEGGDDTEAPPQANTQRLVKQTSSKRGSKSQAGGEANQTGESPARSTESADAGEAKANEEASKNEHSSFSTLPIKEPPLAPQGGQSKRGTRLLEDWIVPESWIAWAVEEGMPGAKAKSEADRFRDYWIAQPGRKGVKLDWQATWRNWIRTGMERAGITRNENASAEPNWRALCRAAKARPESWDRKALGPPPGESGCRVPEAILREFGWSPPGELDLDLPNAPAAKPIYSPDVLRIREACNAARSRLDRLLNAAETPDQAWAALADLQADGEAWPNMTHDEKQRREAQAEARAVVLGWTNPEDGQEAAHG